MLWEVVDNGFLPNQDPLQEFDFVEYTWEGIRQLAEQMPDLLKTKRWRQEVVSYLRCFPKPYLKLREDEFELAMRLFSYFASAYVHAPGEEPITTIPKEIAIPLVEIAEKVGRPPILSYASYCLYNWRKIDANQPPVLGNIELLQNFSLENKRDEDWFILVHVDIEYQARKAVKAALQLSREPELGASEVEKLLQDICDGLTAMNQTLNRMPESCSPDNYYNKVRPYIFGFENVIYEDCFDNQPQTFRGETGAQSSIIPLLITALGIEHQSSVLTTHLNDMRKYMPPIHRVLIVDLTDECDKRVLNYRRLVKGVYRELRDLYNNCVEQLANFRGKHLEYAINYIQKKVQNPMGTGGTPYIPWLTQLRDETLEQRLL